MRNSTVMKKECVVVECPFCHQEMEEGVLSGDGRSKVYWEPSNEKRPFTEKMAGVGRVDAAYSLTRFQIRGAYCDRCQKMILDTAVSK